MLPMLEDWTVFVQARHRCPWRDMPSTPGAHHQHAAGPRRRDQARNTPRPRTLPRRTQYPPRTRHHDTTHPHHSDSALLRSRNRPHPPLDPATRSRATPTGSHHPLKQTPRPPPAPESSPPAPHPGPTTTHRPRPGARGKASSVGGRVDCGGQSTLGTSECVVPSLRAPATCDGARTVRRYRCWVSARMAVATSGRAHLRPTFGWVDGRPVAAAGEVCDAFSYYVVCLS